MRVLKFTEENKVLQLNGKH